jgi:hypothetical protein
MKLDLNNLAVESFPAQAPRAAALAPTYPYYTYNCPPPV